MCDYSLHDVASRPAKVGDKLVSTQFPNAITRGFSDPSQPRVAVCLLPGTELAFEREVECDASFRFLPTRKSPHKVARFRQVNLNRPAAHHDLERGPPVPRPTGIAVSDLHRRGFVAGDWSDSRRIG